VATKKETPAFAEGRGLWAGWGEGGTPPGTSLFNGATPMQFLHHLFERPSGRCISIYPGRWYGGIRRGFVISLCRFRRG
jgi:hypothetical protein